MDDEHSDAYFSKGDTIKMGKSASIPSAEVLDILEVNGNLCYKLEWTTGNVNTKLVDEIDTKAVNTTPKF